MADPIASDETPGIPCIALVHGPGKITLPKNVRDLLGLRSGDLVEVRVIRRVGPDVGAVRLEAAPAPRDDPVEAVAP